MAIRFVEREPTPDETPTAEPPEAVVPMPQPMPSKRRRKPAAVSAESDGPPPEPSLPEPELRTEAPSGPEPSEARPSVAGLLPGLDPPPGAPKRRRGSMIGFG